MHCVKLQSCVYISKCKHYLEPSKMSCLMFLQMPGADKQSTAAGEAHLRFL